MRILAQMGILLGSGGIMNSLNPPCFAACERIRRKEGFTVYSMEIVNRSCNTGPLGGWVGGLLCSVFSKKNGDFGMIFIEGYQKAKTFPKHLKIFLYFPSKSILKVKQMKKRCFFGVFLRDDFEAHIMALAITGNGILCVYGKMYDFSFMRNISRAIMYFSKSMMSEPLLLIAVFGTLRQCEF